jgi:GxxExxY protein
MAMEMRGRHSDITDLILKAFYRVYNILGYGFLEKVYQNSMVVAARGLGLSVVQQYPIRVEFEGILVGEYFADLAINDMVIVEVKAARALLEEHEAQLLNYLKATRFEIGLLLNFGPKPECRRKIYDNWRKGNGSRS